MTTASMTMLLGRQCVDEAGLMRRVAVGDAAAVSTFVGIYELRVRRLAHRLMGWDGELDDIVQDVFVAVMEKAGRFRGEASVWTWVTAITLNRCRTYRRRRAVRDRIATLVGWRQREERPADQPAMDNEVARQVREAVAGLSGRDREVVVLRYLEQKSAAQIGELLGISQNVVEVRLHRARGRLKARLEDFVKGVSS